MKIAISWNPASSDFDFFPEAISITRLNKFLESSSAVLSSTRTPQLKSIQFDFLLARAEFDAILIVGTGEAKGVHLPVVNKTICAPDAARAVDATRSFPGALNKFRP